MSVVSLRQTYSSALMAALSVSLATACASGGGGGKVAGRFTSREELASLVKVPPPAKLFDKSTLEVDRWTLEAPLPDSVDSAVHRPTTPLELLVEGQLSKRPGTAVASEAMTCVAHQVGRFMLEKEGMPADALRTFIAQRCGATVSAFGFQTRSGEVPADVTEQQVVENWRQGLEEMVTHSLEGAQSVGTWFGKNDKRAIAIFAFTTREALIEHLAFVPGAGGKVTVRGELLTGAEKVRGLVNRGRFDYSECTQSATTRLPRFELECTIDPNDTRAELEIAAFQPNRVLGHSVLSTLLWPAGKIADVYERSSPTEAVAAAAPNVNRAVLASINEIRKQAGRRPLGLATKQSETALRAAPHFFAAVSGLEGTPTVADAIVLGLRAGWDVEGLVRNGGFASAFADGNQPAHIVDAALAHPYGREALLDGDAELLAVGVLPSPDNLYQVAVLSTYSLFHDATKGDEVNVVFEKIAETREKNGRATPNAVRELDTAAKKAAADIERGVDSDDALHGLLQEGSRVLRRGVRGFYMETSVLGELTLPRELIDAPQLTLAIAVAHRKVEKEPWGRYVVLVIMIEPNATAALPPKQPARG